MVQKEQISPPKGYWAIKASLFFLLLVVGYLIGINLPDRVYCYSEDALCWHLRFRDKEILKED